MVTSFCGQASTSKSPDLAPAKGVETSADLDKKQGSGAEANGAAEPFVYQSANLS